MALIKNDYTGEPRTLLILGAGGLGQVVAEMAQMSGRYSMIAFLDDHPTPDKEMLYHIVGNMQDCERMIENFTHAIPAFGDNNNRYQWMIRLKKYGYRLPRLIHQSAIVSPTARIGDGCIIRERVVISRAAQIGEGCLINVGAIIDHKVVIGDGCHIPVGCIVRNEIHVPPLSGFHVGEIVERDERRSKT